MSDDTGSVTLAEHAEDQRDLANARTNGPEGAVAERKPFWKSLGPGLITGAADDDPAGIGTYSVTGAQFGYAMLWLTPVCIPLMIAVQEMCGSWEPAFIMTIVGYLGTTISPYLFFWQAGEEVEEAVADGKADAPGKRTQRASSADMRRLRADTIIGMVASQAVTFFIIICAAATLHNKGITEIETAQDAAKALLPLGKSAYWLFTLGILGTGLLAIPTLAGSAAYAVSETFSWRYGLCRRFKRARGFYLAIAAMIGVGYGLNFVHAFSPVKALFYSAVLNGVVAVPLLVVLMLLCNGKTIVKDRVNGRTSNVLGWLTVGFTGAAAGLMVWAMATGS